MVPARRRSCRTGVPVNRNKCIFCGEETNTADHSFQKVQLTKQIHDKAVAQLALGDDRIVAILAEGDLVATEAKYHRFNASHLDHCAPHQGYITVGCEVHV